MKLTVEFDPSDETVAKALAIMIPEGSRDDLLAELDAQLYGVYSFASRQYVAAAPTRGYSELLLARIASVVERLPNHDRACRGLLSRNAQGCDCAYGELAALIKKFRARQSNG